MPPVSTDCDIVALIILQQVNIRPLTKLSMTGTLNGIVLASLHLKMLAFHGVLNRDEND